MASEGYPVRLSVQRQDSQSRITNFPLGIGLLIRSILLIPHLIILYFLQIVAMLLYFIATFAILFTGRFPEGMFQFVAGYLRWQANVYGYLLSMYDVYPPFSYEPQASFPLQLEIDYTPASSRILNFPLFIGYLIKGVLLIPHLIAVAFLGVVAAIVLFIAGFAILFTGSFPEGMHKFMTGVGRWSIRINAYLFALTDKYPPFSMD